MKKRVHIFVSGRVQGVFFRANSKHFAEKLGLTGWVRNLEDGRVEIVAEGEEEKLREFVALVKRGPITAKVEGAEVEWLQALSEFKDFQIRY